MYYKIEEDVLERIEKMTMTDYEAEGNFLPVDSINDIIEDLLYEIDRLQEKISDMEQDIEENYEAKKFNPYTEYGVSEKDFY